MSEPRTVTIPALELRLLKVELDIEKAKSRRLGKEYGKAGATIHHLRGDLAIMRSKDISQVADDLLDARRANRGLADEVAVLRREIYEIRQKFEFETAPAV